MGEEKKREKKRKGPKWKRGIGAISRFAFKNGSKILVFSVILRNENENENSVEGNGMKYNRGLFLQICKIFLPKDI